jgi:hypothetical protein
MSLVVLFGNYYSIFKSAIKLALNGFISGQVKRLMLLLFFLQNLPNFLSQNGIKGAIISNFRAFQWLCQSYAVIGCW